MKPEFIIGKRLREAREELGLTLEAVGVRAGIDETTAKVRISQYENSVHIPPIAVLFKLAVALNKPPAWFVAEEDLKVTLASIDTLSDTHRGKLLVEINNLIIELK